MELNDIFLIKTASITLRARFLETPTAASIRTLLPIRSTAQRWGDEVYFEVPLSGAVEADATEIVEPGDIAFWVEGSCIAIGFGPTPISIGNEIRLAARTNIWARALDDVKALGSVQVGDPILIEMPG